jgi:hypothetical protein
MRKMMFKISKFAPAALLAVGVLVAGEARADRRCELPAAETGRTCPVEVCITMQDAVKAGDACGDRFGAPQPRSCSRGLGCTGNQQMQQRWTTCRDRRNAINATCWGGGDPGHQRAAEQADINVTNCTSIIALPMSQGGCAQDPCPIN